MSITVNHKKPSGYVVFKTLTSGFIALNSNTVVTGANTPGELVNSMGISEVFWSVSGNHTWTVARGSNTVAIYSGSGWHDYQDSGVKLEVDSAQRTSNVVATLSGGGIGFIAIKLHKVSGE